jgi:hypothetical protein
LNSLCLTVRRTFQLKESRLEIDQLHYFVQFCNFNFVIRNSIYCITSLKV